MTTAARPTFEPAKGGRGKGEGDLSALSKQYSSRDMPSHTKLKYRQSGQATSDDLQSRDFRHELEDKERQSRQKREREKGRSFTEAPALTSSSSASSSSTKKPRLEQPPVVSIDADDPVDDDDNDDDDDDDSDEDNTAELMMELQRIRKERMEEQEKKDSERKEDDERIRTENLLKGNPLLNQQTGGNFKIKRRWDDDVVFKNCAKVESKHKDFINDTIRSEFHRKFMDKYVK